MQHGTLTVITKIRPEAVKALMDSLRELEQGIGAHQPHPFRAIEELYFAHWGISGSAPWEAHQPGPPEDCYLVFGADLRVSGSSRRKRQLRAAIELLVDRLATHQQLTGDTTFDHLYSCCEGYPEGGLSTPEALKAYLREHAVDYNARHVDFTYRVASVRQLRDLSRLRAEAEHYLNDGHRRRSLERLGTASVHEALRHHLGSHLTRVSGPEWERSLAASRREAALTTLLYLPLDKLLPPLIRLKNRLRRPRRTVETVTVPDALRDEIEARQGPVQNSMILIAEIPPKWLGRVRQRFFMWLVNWRLKRNLLGMNDIRAIHFARWALFPRGDKKQLLFIVTYDESWEAYIDSFVDHEDVSTFLKLIWGGAQGFPSGTPFVEPFKEWIRSVQCPTLARYSAFLHGQARPDLLAVTDLHEALELRRILVQRSLRAPPRPAEQWALSAFLERGRFPYQEKLLRPWQAVSLLVERLLAPFRLTLPARPRIHHAPTRTMGEVRPQAPALPVPPSPPAGWRRAARRLVRRSGTGRAWVQTHGGRQLPAAED